MDDKPKYDHDCSRCTFLGNYEAGVDKPIFDLYFCYPPSYLEYPTVICRYSSNEADYSSGMAIALALEKEGKTTDPLVVALQRARGRSLYPIMCKQCKIIPVAYYGAIFCGAGCSAEYEIFGKQSNISIST